MKDIPCQALGMNADQWRASLDGNIAKAQDNRLLHPSRPDPFEAVDTKMPEPAREVRVGDLI